VGSFSIWHWAIVAVIVLLLFGGRGKLSAMMGDAAKGVKAFKDGLKDTDSDKPSDERAGALPRTNAEKEDLKS
jgi:sec-independent protein translocase protein TatA